MMIMSGMLTRAQFGRVTWWVQTRYPSPFSTIRFKQCSTTSDPPPSSSSENQKKLPSSSSENQKKLPSYSSENQKKLPEHIVHLTCHSSAEGGYCQVFLVGTIHYSQKSCADVQAIINDLKPEVVFLELCSTRQAILKNGQLKEPSMKEIVTMILKKKYNPLGLLISLFYVKLAKELKIIPGSEFRVAYEEAIKYGGTVVLGDRPAQITLARAWRKMPLSEKINLLPNLFRKRSSRTTQFLEKMLQELVNGNCDINMDMEMVTLFIQLMDEISPNLAKTIIHERDLYMSATLLQEAKKRSCIVAVVGKGHLQGIKNHWKQPVSVTTLKDLLTVPPAPEPIVSTIILTSIGVAMAGVAMMWGYL